MSATSGTKGQREYGTMRDQVQDANQPLGSDPNPGCWFTCARTCSSQTPCVNEDIPSTRLVTDEPRISATRNDGYETEKRKDARSDTHEGNAKYLVVGKVLWSTNNTLQYTIQDTTLSELVPVIAYYSPTDCFHLQARCIRSISCEKMPKIDQSHQLSETVTFTMLQQPFPQRPTDVITISASGWPKLDGGNVLFAPETSTYDLVMTFQRSMLMSLCHCLIITVGVIGRVQLLSLIQILTEARKRNLTVFVFHYVATTKEFEAQRKVTENCLTEPKTQGSLQGKQSTGHLQVHDYFVQSLKNTRLYHCYAHEDAFSTVRTHISSDKVFNSEPNKPGPPCEVVSLLEKFEQTGMQTTLRRLLNIPPVHNKDGKSFMNISRTKMTRSVSTSALATNKSMYSQNVAPIRPRSV